MAHHRHHLFQIQSLSALPAGERGDIGWSIIVNDIYGWSKWSMMVNNNYKNNVGVTRKVFFSPRCNSVEKAPRGQRCKNYPKVVNK